MNIKNKTKDEILSLINERILYIKCTDTEITHKIIDILWVKSTKIQIRKSFMIYQSIIPGLYECKNLKDSYDNYIEDIELYKILIPKTIDDFQTIEF